MHDRTVNGEILVFGNQGGLFMNAMTWWDHQTESVWSQPWGRAIAGPLKGAELELLTSQVIPWSSWRQEYPDTLALKVSRNYIYKAPRSQYVVGIALGEWAAAFPYELAAAAGIINAAVGPYPLLLYVEPEAHSVHAYLRQVDERVLTFVQRGELVQDEQTGSTWRMERGLAVDGPLQGQALRAAPYIPAFPQAWRDFYPHSQWYEDD